MNVAEDLALVNAVDQLTEKDLHPLFMERTEIDETVLKKLGIVILGGIGSGKEVDGASKEVEIGTVKDLVNEETGNDLAEATVGKGKAKTLTGNVVAEKKEAEILSEK